MSDTLPQYLRLLNLCSRWNRCVCQGRWSNGGRRIENFGSLPFLEYGEFPLAEEDIAWVLNALMRIRGASVVDSGFALLQQIQFLGLHSSNAKAMGQDSAHSATPERKLLIPNSEKRIASDVFSLMSIRTSLMVCTSLLQEWRRVDILLVLSRS